MTLTVEVPEGMVPQLLEREIMRLRYELDGAQNTLLHLRSMIRDAAIVDGNCVHLDGSSTNDCKCCNARRVLRSIVKPS